MYNRLSCVRCSSCFAHADAEGRCSAAHCAGAGAAALHRAGDSSHTARPLHDGPPARILRYSYQHAARPEHTAAHFFAASASLAFAASYSPINLFTKPT
jgi:hypothetical protein